MEYKYIQFPICLMQDVIKDRNKGLSLCVNYGLVHFAYSQSYKIEDVARQTVYDYYRNNDQLPRPVRKIIFDSTAEDLFTQDDDYNGFTSGDGKFDATENIQEVLNIFENNPDVEDEAIKHYQLHQAEEFQPVNIHCNRHVIEGYNRAKGIKEAFEAKYGTDAQASVKIPMLHDFRDGKEQDIDLLLGYLGIVSLIGFRKFISTTKPVILSRMIGAKSKPAWEAFSKVKEAQGIVERYSKRYNMDRLLLSLAERKFIMFLTRPHVSLIYVSKYMEPEELAELVRQSQAKYNLKNKIREASKKI